ncbi:SDR family NAD(P)-dependent oxidoreductase [Parasphingorhabdus sp.]|uniref:SDR family NAD(P)-dependent oxidoreductase n=1 Tax=Parasphingorhabdus sp. TaxID=2709688 RepID=UPI003A8DED4D
MSRVTDKVAIVTGAASAEGIGYAIARKLGGEGAKLIITDIDGNEITARAEELSAGGADVTGIQQDVTQEKDWSRVIGDTVARHGKLDILVNNAGIAVLLPTDEMTVEQWHRQIDTNLFSVFLGCRAAVAQMRAQGEGGSIVNISSIAGMIGAPGAAAYCASKGGSRAMTKTIALENADADIRVNSVHPGLIWTPMQHGAATSSQATQEAMAAAIPLKRMGKPDDIASMALFLASEEASYITGSEFVVDGGLTAQ